VFPSEPTPQVIAVGLGEVAFDDPPIAAFFDSFRFTVDI
jgi:hypothetical protein